MNQKRYITASELGDYIYCKRGWWLRFNGLLETTQAMRVGTKKHSSLFNISLLYKQLQYLFFFLLFILIILILGLLLF